MCARFADTPAVRYLPGEWNGAPLNRVHVIKEHGPRTRICWIEYPNTGMQEEVDSSRVFTDPTAADRWHLRWH